MIMLYQINLFVFTYEEHEEENINVLSMLYTTYLVVIYKHDQSY
jgi:hypothetical protein